jgi:hypothetical protein
MRDGHGSTGRQGEQEAEAMTTGYARLSLNTAFHLFGPWRLNEYYLAPACSHTSFLPRAGAKLKSRADLPEGANVCRDCERKENAS